MQRILSTLYAIISAAAAVYCTIYLYQPANFLADIFSSYDGTKYYITVVFLLTWLIFLLPLIIYAVIARLTRNRKEEVVGPGRSGIFVTRKKALQSALLAIPIFINGKKAGVIDNGRTRFFELYSGNFTIQAGSGKRTSELLQGNISGKEQLHFILELEEDGLRVKYILRNCLDLSSDSTKNGFA
jgi:hypothetical protein